MTRDSKSIFEKFDEIINLLTKKETRRYFFDSAILGAIKQELSRVPSRANFSTNIYPSYLKNAWGHKIYSFPVKSGETYSDNFISFIFFPGTETLDNIELDDYAFIFHEIGHELQHHHKEIFIEGFKSELDSILYQENLIGLADKGALKTKNQKLIDDLRQKWSPTDNHENWASEMINDLISLWMLGPAYFYNFESYLSNHPRQNPYKIEQSHPPLALRVEAMIKAANKMGWMSETKGLRELLKDWRSSWSKNNNQYYAMQHEKILQSCIENTLSACQKLKIPLCDRNRINRVQQDIKADDLPNIGIDMIIAAWIVKQQEGETAFLEWEKLTISRINEMIFH